MASDFDITKPGPAGMYFDPSILTPEGRRADRAARDALEVFCDFCGAANAGNAFGSFARSRGVIACGDADCCRRARECVAAAARVPAKPSASPDLFSTPASARRAS